MTRPTWLEGSKFVLLDLNVLRDTHLSNLDVITLLELSAEADWSTGLTHISTRSWVRQGRNSPHSTRRSLERLAALGYLERVETKAGNGGGSTFRITQPKRAESRALDVSESARFRAGKARDSARSKRAIPRGPLNTDSFSDSLQGEAELPPNGHLFENSIGQKAVQHYVDTCNEIGYSPTEEWKSLCGRKAKELDRSGKSLDLVWSAIERIAKQRKSPSALIHVAADIESGVPETHSNGRPNGYQPYRDASPEEWAEAKARLEQGITW